MGMFNFIDNGRGRLPSPAWARKIGKLVSVVFDMEDGTHPVPSIGNREVTTNNSNSSGQSIMLPDLWKTFNDRKSVFNDIEQMIHSDELVSTACEIVADRVMGNSDARQSFKKKPKRTAFSVSSDNKQVKTILDALNRRIDIEQVIWQVVYDFFPHGNCFREVIIDKNKMMIKGFKQTISYQIWPKVNEHGDKLPGWLVITDQDVSNQGGKELEEWQIIDFIYGPRKGFLAVAPLASARRNWQRLSKMEDGMAVARLVRAYDKIVHRIPVKDTWTRDEIMSTIKRYKDAITKRKVVSSDGSTSSADNPLDVQTDFYLPDDGSGKGGVQMLSANNTQLGNLNDVLYHREKLVCRLRVPISYLQLISAQKSHIGGGGMSDADIAFAYTLQRVEEVAIKGISRLYDIELMLNGIAPEPDLYTIELAPIITKDRIEDANIELTYGQAAVYFVEAFGALPPELLADKFMLLNQEQQEMMEKFLGGDAQKVWKNKLKSIALEAKPAAPGVPAGSGNQNKSRAARSSEQKGKAKQSVDLDTVVDVFYQVYSGLASDMGDIPEFTEYDRVAIKQDILARMGDVE